jgi:hypothetical protein
VNVNTASGAVHTASIYAKAGTYSFVQFYLNNQGAEWVNFTLSGSGTVSTNGSCTATITALSDGWYRLTMTYTAGSTDRRPFFILAASGTATRAQVWDPVGTETAHFWGAQLNLGSSAFTYIPTTTAAVYSLPIDHDPITFDPLGVLIEEQRTNLLTYSNLVGGWASLTTGNTIATGEADPAGGTSGTLYTRTAALSYRGQGASKAASAITYTQSFYVKKNTANYAVFTMQGFNSGQRISQSVDLATGVLSAATTAGAFAHVGSSVDTLIDNWYRVKIVFTTDTHTIVSSFITFATSQILTADSNDSASTATGYVYGAQLEAGAFPTSYIPNRSLTGY